MARKLKLITAQISQYLAKRFSKGTGTAHKIPAHISRKSLPAPLYIAFLQGEALLRLRFFAYLNERSISDPDSLFRLWEQLIEDKKFIQQIVEDSGLLNYFILSKKELVEDSSYYSEQCFTVYCILIFDAHESANSVLLTSLTKGLVVHFMPTLYPEQSKITDIKLLKNQIAKQLALKWHIRPEIKESFVTTDGEVVFSLLAKIAKQPFITLITLEGNRLKPTRLKAYQNLLNQLDEGVFSLELN